MHDLLAALDRELPKGSEARPCWATVRSPCPLGLDPRSGADPLVHRHGTSGCTGAALCQSC